MQRSLSSGHEFIDAPTKLTSTTRIPFIYPLPMLTFLYLIAYSFRANILSSYKKELEANSNVISILGLSGVIYKKSELNEMCNYPHY